MRDGGNVRGKRAAGRGDRDALQDSVGGDDWRAVAVRLSLARDSSRCSTVARDHSASRDRTARGIRCRRKSVAGARLRRSEPPCAWAGGARQQRLFRGNVEPALIGAPPNGSPFRNPAASYDGVPLSLPAFERQYTFNRILMIGRMICAFGADEGARLRRTFKKLRS